MLAAREFYEAERGVEVKMVRIILCTVYVYALILILGYFEMGSGHCHHSRKTYIPGNPFSLLIHINAKNKMLVDEKLAILTMSRNSLM